jgi:hypothetical protein
MIDSTVLKMRKRVGAHLIIGSSAAVALPASPTPAAAPWAPWLKSAPASIERPKAPWNPAGDSMKKKQTTKRTALPAVAPAPFVFDVPLDEEIAAGNVFDNMPNRYEIQFC